MIGQYGEEQKEESKEKSSREKQESGACAKMRMEKERREDVAIKEQRGEEVDKGKRKW